MLIINTTLLAQVYPDRHSTTWKDAWISCTPAESPNVKRGNSFWIMYDLGDQYTLQQSTLWNANVPGNTDQGFQSYAVDVSQNGFDWTPIYEGILPQGPGSAFYEGDSGPNFNGIIGRYVLITGLSNYGGNCFSLGEVRINATVATTTAVVDELELDINASPNPANNYTTIEIGDVKITDLRYRMTSTNGQIVSAGNVTSKSMTVNTSAMPTGIYNFTVYSETEGSQKTIQINIIRS